MDVCGLIFYNNFKPTGGGDNFSAFHIGLFFRDFLLVGDGEFSGFTVVACLGYLTD